MGGFKCNTTGWSAKQYESYIKVFHPFCILYYFAYSFRMMFLTFSHCCPLSKRHSSKDVTSALLTWAQGRWNITALWLRFFFSSFYTNGQCVNQTLTWTWLYSSPANYHHTHMSSRSPGQTTDNWRNMIGLAPNRSQMPFCLMHCPQNAQKAISTLHRSALIKTSDLRKKKENCKAHEQGYSVHANML